MSTYLIDTTLRDGEQTPGVAFSLKEKLDIAAMLNELGINEIEAGTPAIGYDEQKSIKSIAKAGFSFITSCWCRAIEKDIFLAAKTGTQSVNISLPVSDIQIDTIGKSRSWVIDQVGTTLSFARQYFPMVTIGAQDASRADTQFLKEFIFSAHDSGANRIRIADTVGIFDPIDTFNLMSELKKGFPMIKLEFHGHNDLGMATANSVAAIKAHTHAISATINGLGERAGNAVMEEIIAYLTNRSNQLGINSHILKQISQKVETYSNVKLPKNKPVTGEGAYKHESGIHTSAILRNINSYQILNPSMFGVKQSRIILGKHSGLASVLHFFNSKGLAIDEETGRIILHKIKAQISITSKPCSEQDILAIYRTIAAYRKAVPLKSIFQRHKNSK